jgi:hypothetical protein
MANSVDSGISTIDDFYFEDESECSGEDTSVRDSNSVDAQSKTSSGDGVNRELQEITDMAKGETRKLHVWKLLILKVLCVTFLTVIIAIIAIVGKQQKRSEKETVRIYSLTQQM